MISVRVTSADGVVAERTFDGDEVVIGRSSQCDLPVLDRSMSRRHARLVASHDGGWQVEDLGSRNGTVVDGVAISDRARVGVGTRITLGGSVLEVSRVGYGTLPGDAPTDGLDGHTMLRPASELLDSHAGPEADPDTLRNYADRLRMLSEIHRALDTSITLDDLLELILDGLFDNLRPEEAAVVLRTASGGYEVAAARSARGADPSWLFSRSLAQRVVEEGQAALVLDTADDDRFREAVSLLSAGVRSLCAAPLLAPNGALGMLVIGSRLASREFTSDDLELLAPLASVAAMRIRNVRLAEEAAERRRLEQEVQLARRIQVALLPDRLPSVAGWEIHATTVPSRGVSGDIYKIVERVGSEVVMLVADVSGKGIGAALLTGALEALTAAALETGDEPDEVCRRVSRLLWERTPTEKYATMFLAVIDVATGRMRYANAGHTPALVVRADGETGWLESTGMPIGILEQGVFSHDEVTLGSGDLVLVYTDGITEAENAGDEEYGVERLQRLVCSQCELPLVGLSAAIETDLEGFAQGVPFVDDRTIVLLRRRATP
jgi:serine phosphatase RsbU (regulator of sigma subunit)